MTPPRVSDVDHGTHRDDPYAAYGEISFNVITDNHNDVFGRTVVRLKELMESYGIVRQIMKNLPNDPITVKASGTEKPDCDVHQLIRNTAKMTVLKQVRNMVL